ncbi:Negative regulator of beta-lactamase expression [Hahella chejuensis KCTC 2396]|uniref:Negative regulator of beta-lactamase expression n=1 Tax=Hahella chejuensis (strain KCTC 2396) TaxID=349521 RepID=Q2SI63_HAHCH|nr:N-acetylmuramoyl-L-alanine amidase [Hahella chejuensis]ABC29661.1 Negative regulator of beta-lactamase expression [Hahella chejuensis KCTC 2396]
MKRQATRFVVVHCSATPASMDVDAETIRTWHKDKGWSDIGYHLVIKRDGTVQNGRDLMSVGAHVRGHNGDSVGVCLIGGVDDEEVPEDNFTEAQKNALRTVLAGLLARFPGSELRGHRDFPGVHKACPSFDVRAWYFNR